MGVDRRLLPPARAGDERSNLEESNDRPPLRGLDYEPSEPDPLTSPEDLVALAQQGDQDAFALLYRRYRSSVARLAWFYLRTGTEDAVAETFCRAWGSLSRYRPTGSPFAAWLYGIARHVVADEYRARKRITPIERLPDDGFVEDLDQLLALADAISRLPKNNAASSR